MIDYLLIGHVSTDLTPTGPKPGGAVTFASRVAQALGYRTAVLTSAASDFDLSQALPEGVEVRCLPADRTTTFENVYAADGRRQQTIHGVARSIAAADVPTAWRRARIVHLAPIAEEVAPDLLLAFGGQFLGLTPQGWLRRWDPQGRVFPKRSLFGRAILPLASAVVVSTEDLVSREQLIRSLPHVQLAVVTSGSQGCVVYRGAEARRFAPPPVDAVDATGAGDTFATAFFIRLHETGDPWEAARFANLLAAHSVTQPDPASKVAEIRRVLSGLT